MTKAKGRVEISVNVEEILTLADKVYVKHKADGASSKLNALEDYNWTEVGPNIAPCLAKHNLAEDLKGKMEKAYRERDLLLPDITGAVRSSSAILKGAFAKNPKKISDWGFSVDDTKSASTPDKVVTA